MKKVIASLIGVLLLASFLTMVLPWIFEFSKQNKNVRLAVEFNVHAAPVYIAEHFGWFKDEGLNVTAFNSYVTGVALANALARGDVDAAYVCLGPVLISYSRGVDIVIVAGTHFHGYALVGKLDINSPKDMEGKRIGIVEPGSNADILFYLLLERYNLNKTRIDVRRANPPLLVTLLRTGQVDAIVVPEHWATVAAVSGTFHVIVKSQDVWPNMQGSVLVVRREIIEKSPEIVMKLVKITKKGIEYIKNNKEDASRILSERLRSVSAIGVEPELLKETSQLISPDTIKKSIDNLDYSINLNAESIKNYLDLLNKMGYIDKIINVEEVVDTRFLK
ncbi:MAG: ABC transporter substrate-binding protein [Nitrososphaerota archaeon]